MEKNLKKVQNQNHANFYSIDLEKNEKKIVIMKDSTVDAKAIRDNYNKAYIILLNLRDKKSRAFRISY